MGFRSSLYGVKVDPERIEAAGQAISKRMEVTHCYERKHPFNLWFTATVKEVFDLDEIAKDSLALPGASELKDLRTLKRLKLNARFSLSKTSFGDGSLLSENVDPSGPEGEDARILAQASEGLALMNRPYREMGDRLGISEDEILESLRVFLRKGWVRRYAGVVSHRAMGYRANALLVRDACGPETMKLAELLRGREDVSHLYLRTQHPEGPEVLCAMIHAKSSPDLKELVGKLPQPEKNEILSTVRCFKRSFFRMPR
jgi:DNA-binding Lrp family transcriptional regulator